MLSRYKSFPRGYQKIKNSRHFFFIEYKSVLTVFYYQLHHLYMMNESMLKNYKCIMLKTYPTNGNHNRKLSCPMIKYKFVSLSRWNFAMLFPKVPSLFSVKVYTDANKSCEEKMCWTNSKVQVALIE